MVFPVAVTMLPPLLVITHTHTHTQHSGDGSMIRSASKDLISLATLTGWKHSHMFQAGLSTVSPQSFKQEVEEGLLSSQLVKLLDSTAIYSFHGLSQFDIKSSICKGVWGERSQISSSNHSWDQLDPYLSHGLVKKPTVPRCLKWVWVRFVSCATEDPS